MKRITNQRDSKKKSKGAESIYCIPQYSLFKNVMLSQTHHSKRRISSLRKFVYSFTSRMSPYSRIYE
jgi:hypothetical protein